MAIEIVDFPIKNGGSFHSYVKLPEGNFNTTIKNQGFLVGTALLAMLFRRSFDGSMGQTLSWSNRSTSFPRWHRNSSLQSNWPAEGPGTVHSIAQLQVHRDGFKTELQRNTSETLMMDSWISFETRGAGFLDGFGGLQRSENTNKCVLNKWEKHRNTTNFLQVLSRETKKRNTGIPVNQTGLPVVTPGSPRGPGIQT